MKNFFSFLMLAMMPVLFAACGDGNDYYGGGGWRPGGGGQGDGLNQYEKQLVGSYVSDDDPDKVVYLVLKNDRSGLIKNAAGGQVTGDEFTWSATSSQLTVVYVGESERYPMDYSFRNNHLYVDGISFVINSGDIPADVSSPIVGQWEGTINGFYESVYGVPAGTYATACEFAANGNGVQLDYDIYNPKKNYAYTPFTWAIANDVLVIKYDVGSGLPNGIAADYVLSDKRFTGTMAYGQLFFGFAFSKTSGWDWGQYQSGGKQTMAKKLWRMPAKTVTKAVRSGVFAR